MKHKWKVFAHQLVGKICPPSGHILPNQRANFARRESFAQGRQKWAHFAHVKC